MARLPPRPDLEEMRRRAEESAGGQPALAREYGFPSWSRLEAEVERRAVLDAVDVEALSTLLGADPGRATEVMRPWSDHPLGVAPLSYVAMMRFDTTRGLWRDVPGSADLARTLLAAGATADGEPGCPETPLMTAASYGDPAVARVLLDAGADLGRTAADTAGGVPGGTALDHAAVFGMTEVVDVLTAAGARPSRISIAAATGDVTGWLDDRAPEDERVRALVMAARHGRTAVIDDLVAGGTPVDAVDPMWGGHPLRSAVSCPAGVRRLLEHGADPGLRDGVGRTALDLCRIGHREHPDADGYAEVEALLVSLTEPS
ncbi:ankyrin repeat domain-containing protein [Pseudonocardia sp. KRD291]|uniref:ankyrin repeat domain-containing protein n=1 Tax=Pseudonocardia sp. KRD291 TaxID=2792007 RepID=UPI001C4A572B|nr:ankyrin repeat domain-containing protein [Pseudonocardia sp. KRD291]MBW0103631.1 ankyrin repeat domain-containing protein [Pseudonocardia sp. KRD291]